MDKSGSSVSACSVPAHTVFMQIFCVTVYTSAKCLLLKVAVLSEMSGSTLVIS